MDWATSFTIIASVVCVTILICLVIEVKSQKTFERKFIARVRKGWRETPGLPDSSFAQFIDKALSGE